MTTFEEHLARLRTQGRDDEQIEVKELAVPAGTKKPDSAGVVSLWESVSAFANTHGGLLFLGLSERNGFTPAPGFDATAVTDLIHQGLNETDHTGLKVEPVPGYSVTTEQVDGAPVVVLAVDPLTVNGPCHLRKKGIANGSFKRVGDADRKLTTYEIYELQHRFDQLTVDAGPVPGTGVTDLDEDLVAEVRKHLKATGSRAVATGDDRWLRYLNITTDSGELTLAGLLTLGVYPQQYFPRLFIDVAVHPGTTKGNTATERFLDRRLCDGNLQVMMQDALLAIRKTLRTRRVVTGARGTDVLEIPEDALREALANAVMHRDYSPLALGNEINVDIFPDRVEITSPGGFPGAKSADPESLVDGIPVARNRLLTRLLAEVPWPDETGGVLAESNGSGIPRMFAAMQDAGLLVPEYDVGIARVKVTLRRFGLVEPDTRNWLSAALGDGYGPAEGIAMVLARDLGTVSVADLRRQTGKDSDDLRELVAGLVHRGVLVEASPDHFRLPDPTDKLTAVEQDVIGVLSTTAALSTREIADATDRSVGVLRPVLRTLVDAGLVTPTAPPTSRNRKYLLAEQ